LTAIAANYRIFDLPWPPTPEEERRFRRMLRIALGVFVIAGLILPMLPQPAKPPAPALPDEVIELMLTPPPVPKPPEVKKPPPPVVPVKPVEQRPVPNRQEDARRKANQAGLLAMKDQLEDLRETLDTSSLVPTKNLTAKTDGPSRAERSLITSQVATSSGGINTSALSRAYGSGTGSLKGQVATQRVASFSDALAAGRAEAARTGKSGKASRSREEIEMVFDRNKAAIYAIYNRALRDRPELQGKVVIELTIAPSGEVTACRVVSTELGDADLERKLVARIRMFQFEAKDVETITTTKPIEFFPA
jgi:periplasmic protein TonB